MGIEVVGTLVGLFCTTVSSLVTFFLTKRKYNTEVDSQQIHNMGESFDVYKKMMEEALSSQKATLENTIEAQDKKIDMLQKENDSLRSQVGQLQMQMINILGSICLDSTCRLRKMNFASDIKINDKGITIADPKEDADE